MKRKKRKKDRPAEADVTDVDEALLLDSNDFYWTFIRPAEDAAEARTKRRAARRARQKARLAEPVTEPEPPVAAEATERPTEAALIATIERVIRSTHHAYGWRHLGELGQQIRQVYPALQWADYGCKKLLDFLQKYPALFKIKWSSPAHKGASHIWVRIAYEPKLKEGYKTT